ncbi:MAG: DUF4198 domain-containing protein [Desulfobacterales bacterium]|nr:DUF4198 domain-containing protein [Desulfobacterales bacterium]
MKQKIILMMILTPLVMFTIGADRALAHNFFVSVTESMAHPPGHITINLGWGHALPMDDFLTGDKLATYGVYDPDLKKIDFPFNPVANKGVENSKGKDSPDFPGGTILEGDAYCRQLLFKDIAPQGTYQIAASMKKTQFNIWIDQKGKERWGRQPLDQIKGARKVKRSLNYQSFAKAFTTVGKWTQPKALGHDLELIPLTDLTQVHVGDIVSFKVLYMGQPVQSDMDTGLPQLVAFGDQYGASGEYGLKARISKGVAKLRVTAPGRWLALVKTRQPVTEESGPKELVGKCLEVGYNATVTFSVHSK